MHYPASRSYLSCLGKPTLNGLPALWAVLFSFFSRTAKLERILVGLMRRNRTIAEEHLWTIHHFQKFDFSCVVVVLARHLTSYFEGLEPQKIKKDEFKATCNYIFCGKKKKKK